MKFDLTDDQQIIERTVRDLLADRLTGERLRALLGAGAYDEALWQELCDLGFAGTAVPAEHGGQGLGLLELGLVAEALGYALAPVPFVANAAAGLVVAACGSEEQRAGLLPGIASGERRGALAVLVDGVDPLALDVEGAATTVVVGDAGAVVAGPGLAVEPTATIDLLRRYAVVRGPVSGTPLAGDGAGGVDEAEILLAAELTGVGQRALDLAVAYACEREQFGRPIGSFQGVSHRCAASLIELETARSTWRYAAWVAARQRDDLPVAASTAKVAAIGAARRATTDCLQVLGGIGFTWEHDVHLLLRRARVGGHVLGGADAHRRRIARILRESTTPDVPVAGRPA